MYLDLRSLLRILALIALLTAAFFYYSRHFAPPGASLPSAYPTPNNTAPQLLEKLKLISELHTAIGVVQTIVTSSQDRKLFGIDVASTKLLYVAVGQVRAGIDLASLKPNDIRIENSRLHVTLPAPKILDTKIDVEHSYIYDVSKSLVLAPDSLQLQSDVQKKALEAITSTAVKNGVLDAAAQQAKTILSAILTTPGFEFVDVSIENAGLDRGAPPPDEAATIPQKAR